MSHEIIKNLSADEALEKLKSGNQIYMNSRTGSGDISPEKRLDTCRNGQQPYAIIITCSDSRVIPEAVFDAGIGELFVIRSAGNVVDGCTLGSLEYAVGHMGVRLVVVMGHTSCGAIAEAIKGLHEGHSIEIIDDIREGIGDEKDPTRASVLNVRNSVRIISGDIGARHGIRIIGALYDIRTGKAEFLP